MSWVDIGERPIYDRDWGQVNVDGEQTRIYANLFVGQHDCNHVQLVLFYECSHEYKGYWEIRREKYASRGVYFFD